MLYMKLGVSIEGACDRYILKDKIKNVIWGESKFKSIEDVFNFVFLFFFECFQFLKYFFRFY